jgi:hypothetical protein
MTDTLWKWTLFLFAPTAANTANNRNTLADIYVAHGSGESVANERLMFIDAPRLALSSAPTVLVARGLICPVKQSMRDALQTAIETINTPLSAANKIRWYAIAAIDLPTFAAGQLIASNRNTVDNRVGTAFTWQDALTDLGLVEMTS